MYKRQLLDTDKSRNLSEKNLVADINDYVERDDSFEKDDYLPVFYEQGEDENGKLFALDVYKRQAQLVEQRTENPRVAGSIPALGIFVARSNEIIE